MIAAKFLLSWHFKCLPFPALLAFQTLIHGGVVMYVTIGSMPMPVGFKYKDIFLRGRPRHTKWDTFSLKHPPMPASRWAKIFSPFDALEGFDERIAEKEVLYTQKKELSGYEKEKLDQKLQMLRSLTLNSRMARKNRVMVTISCFSPCRDANHDAYGSGGQYKNTSGMVLNVGMDYVLLLTEAGEQSIFFDDILSIEIHTA